MNWDWDKLKEKQKSQQNWSPFAKNQNNDDEGNYNDYQEDNKRPKKPENNEKEPEQQNERKNQHIDFRNLYTSSKKSQNNGNNNQGNNFEIKIPFNKLQKSGKWGIAIVCGVVVIGWLLTGIYIIQPDEAGVVLRFGKYAYTTDAGPHYHMPFPIEQVYKPKVTQIRQAEVGFRTQSSGTSFQQGQFQVVGSESAMLTGDENIVNIQFSIQYRIMPDAAVDYLFNVTDPDAVLKKAAEAAMREVIGNNNIDSALTDGKLQIQNDVATLLQSILDKYKVGLQVVAVQMQDVQPPKEVGDAFKDVASAREDKIRLINESEAYRNELLPKARGSAAEIINQAEAYKQTRIRNAEGESVRFLAILEQYNRSPDITKQRLVFEALENVLSQPGMEKIILSEGASNLVPILPLTPNAQPLPSNALPSTSPSSLLGTPSVSTPLSNAPSVTTTVPSSASIARQDTQSTRSR